MDNNYFEAVETCPHCDKENVYPMWDVSIKGYVAVCTHCGKEIFLCDECMHTEDNPHMNCDWCKTECGGKCFRGITIEKHIDEEKEFYKNLLMEQQEQM